MSSTRKCILSRLFEIVYFGDFLVPITSPENITTSAEVVLNEFLVVDIVVCLFLNVVLIKHFREVKKIKKFQCSFQSEN